MVQKETESESRAVKALFRELMRAPLRAFPDRREEIAAPRQQGVYVIYIPSRGVLHVGATARANGGIAQRLRNHLSAQSSFVLRYLDGDGSQLREGYMFRCLVVENRRFRALLEAFAIGHLCPAHIGYGSAPTTRSE